MARIAGVNIPSQKKLGVALTYVYGVGKKVSIDVLEALIKEKRNKNTDITPNGSIKTPSTPNLASLTLVLSSL